VQDPAQARSYIVRQKPYTESLTTLQTGYERSAKKGTWKITRANDGASADTVSPEFDVKKELFGELLIGNYPADIRAKILGKIAELHPYSYDPSLIVSETINNHSVTTYKISVDVDKTVALNRYTATLIGVTAPDWKYMVSYLALERYYSFDTATHEIIQIKEVYGRWNSFADAQKAGSVTIENFSNIDSTTVPTTAELGV